MKRAIGLIGLLMTITWCPVAVAQPVPAALGGTGCPATVQKSQMATYAVTGNICKLSNANAANDCNPATGTGAFKTVCWYDGSAWAVVSSAGGVTGPGTSTDNAVAVYDGTGGDIQNSEIATTDEDADGTQDGITAPGGLVAGDRNAISPAKANLLAVLDNDVNIASDPTCANIGAVGRLTIVDDEESAADDDWEVCHGVTPMGELASAENLKVGSAATLPTCDADNAGKLYWDTTAPELCYCNGSSWVDIDGGATCL